MNGKENYLRALRHEDHEWVPVEGEDLLYTGFEFNSMDKGPMGGGLDGFGVRWTAPDSGGGTAIPAPGEFLLDPETVVHWRDIVHIPDASAYHWDTDAATQLEGVDRTVMCVDYGDGNGPFERLAALMGFQNALIAMAIEPAAVADLLGAITDFKVACVEQVARCYQPDTFTEYDDVATQASTFMSPEAYRELISPQHKRIVDAVKAHGMIPIRHCCGRAEDIAEDFMSEGYAAWASVQPCNDIATFLRAHGNDFCIAGGYDTNGAPGGTDDRGIIRADVERCFDAYGDLPGYIFAGFIMLPVGEGVSVEDVWAPCEILVEEACAYSHAHKELVYG